MMPEQRRARSVFHMPAGSEEGSAELLKPGLGREPGEPAKDTKVMAKLKFPVVFMSSNVGY